MKYFVLYDLAKMLWQVVLFEYIYCISMDKEFLDAGFLVSGVGQKIFCKAMQTNLSLGLTTLYG